MISIATMDTTQHILTQYGMTTYLILGNIGLIFNILFFCQRIHRHNSCALYLLASTVCRVLTINISLIPIFYALNHADLRNTSLVFCKLQYYARHVPNQMMRTFIVLACIDRYASSSTNPLMRSFSQYYIAIRVIPCAMILWILVTLFIPILQSIENGKCGMYHGNYAFAYTIYNLITSGLCPPIFMIIFSSLVISNLKYIRSRVQPTCTTETTTTNIIVIRKKDRYLIRMMLVEVIAYIVTTTPYTIVLLYSFTTRTFIKTAEEQKLESFLSFLAQSFLLQLNNALPFWIFMLTLESFRSRFKKWMTTIFKTCMNRFIRSSDDQYRSTSMRIHSNV